jgi:hypothetical protein
MQMLMHSASNRQYHSTGAEISSVWFWKDQSVGKEKRIGNGQSPQEPIGMQVVMPSQSGCVWASTTIV